MGLFGFGGDAPELNLPDAPQFGSAQDFLQSGVSFGEEQFPLALRSREEALGILQDPARTTEFFQGFQPTSFEQALANQSFQNIFPDVQKSIKQNLSLSGIESSPILAQQIGRARGELGVDIGNILAQLGQQRGMTSLQSQLGIDPLAQIVGPVAEFGQEQDKLQKLTEFQRALAQAQIDFQQEQAKYNQRGSFGGDIGSLLGTIGGGIFGGPGGAALGAGIGGSAGNALFGFGDNQSPVSLGDSLSMAELFSGNQGNIFGQQGQGERNSTLGNTFPTSGFDLSQYGINSKNLQNVFNQ